ncbi:DUF2066 domain-containing protein [Thiolapillus sp.]
MKILSLFFIVFLLQPVQSFAGASLYSVEVPIADTTPEARKASIRQAFEQVLAKASGHRNLKGRSGMKGLLKQAEDYVQQFRYRSEPAEKEGEPHRRWMWVAFEKSAIQKALAKLGLSVWDKGRPEVLLWLAKDVKGRRVLLDPEKDLALVQALNVAAERRGLPLLLPLMDLEDQTAMRVSDVWTADRESIEKASARYGEQLLLAGRLRQSGGKWKAKWTLFLPNRQQEFSSVSDSMEEAVSDGIDKTMDWLADQYVPRSDSSESGQVKLRFLGIGGLRDYSRLMRLLETLDVISEFAIQESSGDQLLIQARVRGGRELLAQRLSLENDLTAVASVPDDENDAPDDLELTYRLR